MGRFSVEVVLTNDADLVSAEAGTIGFDQVRREVIRGVVDRGATRLARRRLGLSCTTWMP